MNPPPLDNANTIEEEKQYRRRAVLRRKLVLVPKLK
jgi:hypothetical protein